MARMARVVAEGYPHHVTQRGNRRQQVFFGDEDYCAYLDLLREFSRPAGLQILAYCLMPNHVHLVVVPQKADSLRAGLAEAHRRYTRRVNFREGWRGHLWQERFASFVLDEPHLLAAVRYVENNPVRAGLVSSAEQWTWSSARAHLCGRDDGVVAVGPMLELVPDWRAYLSQATPEAAVEKMRQSERTGRPCGSESFVARLGKRLGRSLLPRSPGRPKKATADAKK